MVPAMQCELVYCCHPDAKALNVSFDIGSPKFAVERVEIGRAGTDPTVSGGKNLVGLTKADVFTKDTLILGSTAT